MCSYSWYPLQARQQAQPDNAWQPGWRLKEVLSLFTKSVSNRRQRVWRLVAALLAVALPVGLWVGGSQPVAVGLIPTPWDKLAHAGVFALLAAVIGYASGLRGWRVLLLAFVGAMGVGVVDELHQLTLPGRAAGLDDLAADATGAALGAWAIYLRHR